MQVTEIASRYIDTIPFVQTETVIWNTLIQRSTQKAINYYNKYDPITRIEMINPPNEEYTFTGSVPEAIFRVYYHMIAFDDSVNNLMINWDYRKPLLRIYPGLYDIISGYYYTIDNLTETILDEKDRLDELIEAEIIISLSNKRRMGTLNELPMDFKGDQFFQEATDARQKIREDIAELITPITF